MLPVLLSIATFFSTFTGGVVGIKNRNRLHQLLGFTAGVLIAVVAFDILPEIFKNLSDNHISPTIAMVSLVCGYLLFHIIEKTILIHHAAEEDYPIHHHPQVGVACAIALIGHSFLDGVGIGLGFKASTAVGIAVAIAVIAHDFTDGLNTVNLMLINNKTPKAMVFLFFDAIAPLIGVISVIFITPSPLFLIVYLGFFAGFLLYIGSSQILPEAHSNKSSYSTIGLTILGVIFIFIVTRFI